jgi:hypothetical protein
MSRTKNVAVANKTRAAWGREGGARRRYSTKRVEAAFAERRRDGWEIVRPANGPRFERIVALWGTHLLFPVARLYGLGVRWFGRGRLEEALGRGLDTRAGADGLAAAGFAIARVDGPQVELRAADPRTARLVNRARLGPQYRGYDARTVVEAVLALPRGRRRSPITASRRERAAEVLEEVWGIGTVGLREGRPHVRLSSGWTRVGHPAALALTS